MEIILFIGLGLLFLFIILGFRILSKHIKQIHSDVRKVREYAFWSQRREREARRLLRKYGK